MFYLIVIDVVAAFVAFRRSDINCVRGRRDDAIEQRRQEGLHRGDHWY
mgnify:FL=1